jgi:hypothetical protein
MPGECLQSSSAGGSRGAGAPHAVSNEGVKLTRIEQVDLPWQHGPRSLRPRRWANEALRNACTDS